MASLHNGNLDLRVGDEYRLVRKIGEGSFGYVYEGAHVQSAERFAIKLEHTSVVPSLLFAEVKTYQLLSGGAGVPKVYWSGEECEFRAMVFDLLGPSLEDLLNYCGRKMSLKTVLMLADQLIPRLNFIHSKGVIHRDIKPANILLGLGKRGNQVYMTDLGLSMSEHAATAPKSHGLLGTSRYASINGHQGNVQSYRDDLESLGYVFLYLLRGHLPWQGLRATSSSAKAQAVYETKLSMSVEELCDGLPPEFLEYFQHVQSLDSAEKPDYRHVRKVFRNLFNRSGYQYDHVYDWTILKFRARDTTACRVFPHCSGIRG